MLLLLSEPHVVFSLVVKTLMWHKKEWKATYTVCIFVVIYFVGFIRSIELIDWLAERVQTFDLVMDGLYLIVM